MRDRLKKTRVLWFVLLLELALFLTLISGKYLESFTNFSARLFLIAPLERRTSVFMVLTRLPFQEHGTAKRWEEKIFKGKTRFVVHEENEGVTLSASSRDSCSGLYAKVDREAAADLYLSWKWKAVQFPQKKDPGRLSNKSEDDFAARVYVMFAGPNFFKSDVIEYIWDERILPGTAATSPYTERVKLLVLQSGPSLPESDGWQTEERNIREDYRKLFGKTPSRPISVIALMSDSDNTGTQSEAFFAEFTFKKKLKEEVIR